MDTGMLCGYSSFAFCTFVSLLIRDSRIQVMVSCDMHICVALSTDFNINTAVLGPKTGGNNQPSHTRPGSNQAWCSILL